MWPLQVVAFAVGCFIVAVALCFGAEYTVQAPLPEDVHDFGSQSWVIVNSSGVTVDFCSDEVVCKDWAEALNEAHNYLQTTICIKISPDGHEQIPCTESK